MKIAVHQLMYGTLPYFELAEKINRLYCERHGYEYAVSREIEVRTNVSDALCYLDIMFGKIKSTAKFMRTTNSDYILFMDADAVFYSHDMLIEEELIAMMGNKSLLIAVDGTDMSTPESKEHLLDKIEKGWQNSGVFLFRNDIVGQEIINFWADTYWKYRDNDSRNFWHDQEAFQNDVLPRYQEHIYVTPDWYRMNGNGQYIRHFMGWRDHYLELKTVLQNIYNRITQ